MVDVKPEDIETLVTAFDGSTWDEVRVKVGKFEIHLSKNPADRDGRGATAVELTNLALPAAPAASGGSRADAPATERPAVETAASGAAAGGAAVSAVPEGMEVIRAPNFGTFYRAPKPGAAPYIEVGQRVEASTEVCLIEVMKLFTPVRAGTAGIIRGVLVKDSAMVEFDQPLFIIEPA